VKPSISIIYQILVSWAKSTKPQTYTQLSNDYHAQTGDWFEPHGSWDVPLGELNMRLAEMGAPALSALVILKEKNEPGNAFWGCASNVPSRPKGDIERLTEWNKILIAVSKFSWPSTLPP